MAKNSSRRSGFNSGERFFVRVRDSLRYSSAVNFSVILVLLNRQPVALAVEQAVPKVGTGFEQQPAMPDPAFAAGCHWPSRLIWSIAHFRSEIGGDQLVVAVIVGGCDEMLELAEVDIVIMGLVEHVAVMRTGRPLAARPAQAQTGWSSVDQDIEVERLEHLAERNRPAGGAGDQDAFALAFIEMPKPLGDPGRRKSRAQRWSR